MALDSSAIGFLLMGLLLVECNALRDVHIIVPSAVIRGDDATLQCTYNMEDEQLYAVKWYFGTTEFYRYTPKEIPPMKQFPSQIGLVVSEVQSNDTHVVLQHVPMSVSGRYSCEVSADAPSFFTSVQSGYLQVVDLPHQGPYITGVRERYHHGDILKANCTSEHANPAVNLTWYINGVMAERMHVHNYQMRSADGLFHTSHSVLRLKITKQTFQKHKLKIRCVARMYDIYSISNEKSIGAEKKRHSHDNGFIQRVETTTPEGPVQWELAQPAGSHPETTLVFQAAAEGSTTTATSVLLTGILLALLR